MPDLSAKVAKVLSKSEIVINVGEDDGVAEGNTVSVTQNIEIYDPDTNESIGTIERTILTLRVISVQPRLSIARIPARNMVTAAMNQRDKEIVGASAVDSTSVTLLEGDDLTVYIAGEPTPIFGLTPPDEDTDM